MSEGKKKGPARIKGSLKWGGGGKKEQKSWEEGRGGMKSSLGTCMTPENGTHHKGLNGPIGRGEI